MASILQALQDEITAQLLATSFFSSIPVLPNYPNVFDNVFDRAIARVKTCVIVDTPEAEVGHPNMPGPFLDNIKVLCQVFNNPTLDGPPYALEIAENVAFALHLWTPSQGTSPIVADMPCIKLLYADDTGQTVMNARFKTVGGQWTPPSQSATPILTYTPPVIAPPSPASLAMGTITPGAAIYWSTDPSINPSPAGGTLYTAPFTPTSGLTYRARAWIYGQLPSATATITIP